MHIDGPAVETMALGDKLGLDGLVDPLRSKVHELLDYLHELAGSTCCVRRWTTPNSKRA